MTTTAWRAVEAQHIVSTRKLVDTDEQQQVLEDLIETSKPPVPEAAQRLHYLLFTSFRYPPLRHGSRFGTRTERGIWYGAEELRTMFAEVAYYRLLFLEGTEAKLDPLMVELSVFRAPIASKQGVDLTEPPFDEHAAQIASKNEYAAAQALGAAMREDGVQVVKFPSARDAEGGTNVAVFDPVVFSSPRPKSLTTWLCTATREAVEFSAKDFFKKQNFRFEREQFLVDGKLPQPAP